MMRWGYRRPIVVGSLGMSLGLALLALEPGGITLAGISLSPVIVIMLLALTVGVAAGLVSPSSNNACIELMPDKAASITGVRQLARRTGGILAVTVSTVVLQSSASMGHGFTLVFGGLACCYY